MLSSIYTKFFAFITAVVLTFYTPTAVVQVNPSKQIKPVRSADLTVMSYNLKVSGVGQYAPAKRAPSVIENIRVYKPDSFGVQECSEFWYDTLRDEMTEYGSVGLGRDKDNTGEASPVFYLKSKYKLIDSGTFWMSETPEEVSKGWDAAYNRVCTYAVLKNIKTGFTYAHFNAHFDHLGIVARIESVSVVSKKAAEICKDIPLVFTGDLNDEEGSVMYERILESGMRDTKYLADEMTDLATYHGYSALTEAMRTKPIDFCFVNYLCTGVDSYKVDMTKYNGIYPSDHHPIIIDLTLGN